MWYVLYEEHVCSTFLMRNRKPVPHRRLTTYMSLIQNVPHTCSSYEIYHIHTPHIKLTSYMSAYQILFPDTKFTSQLLLTQALSQNFMNNVIAQQWVFLQDPHYLLSLCFIMFHYVSVGKLSSNQLFKDESFDNTFDQRIMLKSLKIISLNDTKHKIYFGN